MKEIKAYVRRSKMNEVVDKLKDVGVKVMSIIPVERIGTFENPQASELDLERVSDHSMVSKLEIVCRKEDVELIVDTIKQHAKTGVKGDGAIFISQVEHTIKIRTGKEGVITLDSHCPSSNEKNE